MLIHFILLEVVYFLSSLEGFTLSEVEGLFNKESCLAVKFGKSNGDRKTIFFESLILAQDERWRRALSMQVEREDDSRKIVVN